MAAISNTVPNVSYHPPPRACDWAKRQGIKVDQMIHHFDPSSLQSGDIVLGSLHQTHHPGGRISVCDVHGQKPPTTDVVRRIGINPPSLQGACQPGNVLP